MLVATEAQSCLGAFYLLFLVYWNALSPGKLPVKRHIYSEIFPNTLSESGELEFPLDLTKYMSDSENMRHVLNLHSTPQRQAGDGGGGGASL